MVMGVVVVRACFHVTAACFPHVVPVAEHEASVRFLPFVWLPILMNETFIEMQVVDMSLL